MLLVSNIISQKEQIVQAMLKRNIDVNEQLNSIIELDKDRRKVQTTNDQCKAELNNLSKEVGQLFKSGKTEEAQVLKTKSGALKEQIKSGEVALKELEEKIQNLLFQIPNIPNEKVPKGVTDADNEEIERNGDIPKLPASSLPHWELTKKYDIIDFELGAKITGAGFPVYKGKGAQLQRALISFFLAENIQAGYTEYQLPLMVNEDSAYGTGQLPDKEGQMYHVNEDNLYLIPTSEVPGTNIFRNSILKENELPQMLTSYTPCFRREAGSYGAHVRGLNRLHQFDKVEIIRVEHPSKSYEALEGMINHIKGLLEKLELPYRILRLCGGDLTFASAITYDFEVYSAAQEKWLEVSSVSNFETYQANRLKLRYKPHQGKPQLLHTLNGSSLALPRIMAALIENNQTESGIQLPQVLKPYMEDLLVS